MNNLLFLVFIMCTNCGQKTISVPQQKEVLIPIELRRDQMEAYSTILPAVLKKSQEFRKLDYVEDLSDEVYHENFYNYLFQDEDMKVVLNRIGFDDQSIFSEFHNQVVYNYLLIQDIDNKRIKNGEQMIESAVSQISELERETAILLLKQAREPNNIKLQHQLKLLQAKLVSYKNLVLIKAFYSFLKSLNSYAEQ